MIYDSRVGFPDLKAFSLKQELEREDINKPIAYMKTLMTNATDRISINHDNYQFYFNKLLTLNNIKIQNDVLTKEMIMGKGIKSLSTIGGIISSGLIIFSYIYPDKISRNAGYVAMGASTMLCRVNTLVNVGYGEELDRRSGYTNNVPPSGYSNNDPQNTICEAGFLIEEEYIDQCNCEFVNEEMGSLNRKGGKFLNKLYINNEEFKEEIINFSEDKKELDLELILDKRCKTITLNTLGNNYLAECITSKDNT